MKARVVVDNSSRVLAKYYELLLSARRFRVLKSNTVRFICSTAFRYTYIYRSMSIGTYRVQSPGVPKIVKNDCESLTDFQL